MALPDRGTGLEAKPVLQKVKGHTPDAQPLTMSTSILHLGVEFFPIRVLGG
jgi:hypothetical protein